MWNKENAKRTGKRILLGILPVSLLLGGCGGETEVNRHPEEFVSVPVEEAVEEELETEQKTKGRYEKKEETVNVKADAFGAVKEITVTTRLSGGEEELVEDRTSLTDIRNTEGDERYRLSESGELLWENLGEDIVYEGKSDAPLPVDVQVTYFLDGKETDPEELAGQAGHVKIRFDYENHEKRTETIEPEEEEKEDDEEEEKEETCEVYVPFLCFSGVILDREHFSDVSVENGRVMKTEEQTIAFGSAYPGLKESLRGDETKDTDRIPDFVEIEADTDAFSIDETVTLISLLSEEEPEKEESEEFFEFLGIRKTEEDSEETEEVSLDISGETNAIKNDLIALQQQITDSPTLSMEEKQALLLALQQTGDHFSRLGSKLSKAKEKLEKVKDAADEMEELSDSILAVKHRGQAVLSAGRDYEGYAGIGAFKKSDCSFLIETEKVEK